MSQGPSVVLEYVTSSQAGESEQFQPVVLLEEMVESLGDMVLTKEVSHYRMSVMGYSLTPVST